jgi:Caspase domain
MDEQPDTPRRALLGLMAGAPLLSATPWTAPLASLGLLAAAGAVQAAVPTDRITVMYRRESPEAPSRLEPVIQAATLALEREFRKEQFRVLQPTAEVYQLLDQGQGVVITFATDAGFSLVFSAYADLRPMAGQDSGMAEVRLATRVFVGRHILFADEGRGQMVTRLEPATREFGVRRAMEAAARRAAADVAEKAVTELKALTPERINEMVGAGATSTTTAQVVSVPAAGSGGGGSSVVAPPPLPPSAGPAPAPAAPAPGAAPVAPPALSPSPAPSAAGEPLPAPRNRYSVVVGMSNYSVVREANKGWDIADLPGVARDVDNAVQSLGKLGYAKERMVVLRDRQATSGALRGAIKDLAGKVQPEDSVVVFIAGHGGDKDESSSGYGMPVLADHKNKDPNALDFWELQSFMKNLKGRVVWINDTCHSGGAVSNIASVVVSSRGVSAQVGVKGPDALTVASNSGPGQDFAILTACAPSEVSLEEGGGGGLFTTALFRELVRAGGQAPLGQVFAQTVARQVIDQSIKMCRSSNVCASNTQQTPQMAFSGRGAQFRI